MSQIGFDFALDSVDTRTTGPTGSPLPPVRGTTPLTRACSQEGAEASRERAASQLQRIYELIVQAGARGMTRWELEQATDIKSQALCGRIGTLKDERRIAQNGQTRKSGAGVSNHVLIAVERMGR